MYRPKTGSKYTPEIVRFMKKCLKNCDSVFDLVSLVNKRFNTSFTYKQIMSAKYINGIKLTKKKWGTKLPIGAEYVSPSGYTWIKVSLKGKTQWKRKSRVIWEQAHGKIPKNQRVIFLDGNKNNFELDNLALATDIEVGVMNRNGLRFEDKEMTKTGLAIARHKIALNKAVKRQEKSSPVPVTTGHYKNRTFNKSTYFIDKLGNKIFVDKADNGLYYIFKNGKKGKKELKTKFSDIVQYRKTAKQSLQDLLAYAGIVGYTKPIMEAV